MLSHLQTCCPKETCRVFIYTFSAESESASVRTHVCQRCGTYYTKDDWKALATNVMNDADAVNNEWTGAEATAFVKHVVEYYTTYRRVATFY